jgi:hypothetical protein
MPDQTNWQAPTLDALIASLKIVLRDNDSPEVFTFGMCQQFLDDGINELNQIRPREVVGTIDADSDISGELAPRLDEIWKVEYVDPEGFIYSTVPASDGDTPGWVFYGRRIRFDGQTRRNISRLIDQTEPPWTLRWYGYQLRDMTPASGSGIVEFDVPEDEFLVLRYGRWAGLRSLNNDRSLFQQWVQQTNNTDVSPTQLNQMVAMAEQEWLGLRRRSLRVRRVPVGAT